MNYRQRLLSLLVIDFVLLFLGFLGAFLLRFETEIPLKYIESFKLMFIPWSLVNLSFLYLSGLYRRIWQYASIGELASIFKAITLAALFAGISNEIFKVAPIPFTVYLLSWALNLLLIGGSRFTWRFYRDSHNKRKSYQKNALIIGAGIAGGIVAREMVNSKISELYPVGFVDDAPAKQNLEAYGFPVLGKSKDISAIAKNYEIQEIIIAMPSANNEEIRRVLEICRGTGVKTKILPGVYDLITERVKVEKIREVDVEDVLGREPVKVNLHEIADYLAGETVLVTGAGGSIGSELCRQVAKIQPKRIILLGHGENSIYDIELELKDNFPSLNVQTEICDIKDKQKIDYIFSRNKPNVVFHAAAHKHVPLMERNPEEAVKNNFLGTKNVAEASDKFGVKTFVLISTDKAVNPTSVMGATKRLAEMVIQHLDKISETKFVAVRFGNVLGSRGSVVPLFKKQIAKGGPVTVTHPEMVRYFMTIPEAVQLVIQAGSMANGGEIFVLDMGKPVKIADLAKDLIRLSGYEPELDVEIKYTGIRPGEKLYEEIMTDEEGTASTRHKRIFVAEPNGINQVLLYEFANKVANKQLGAHNQLDIIDYLIRLIPTFNPQNKTFKKRHCINEN